MTNPDDLSSIIDLIATRKQTEADINTLRQILSSSDVEGTLRARKMTLQLGKYNVNIEEGQDIHVGDRIYQGVDAGTIREMIQSIFQEIQLRNSASRLHSTSTTENQAVGIFVSQTGQEKFFSVVGSSRVGEAIVYENSLKQITFNHWSYLWSNEEIINFEKQCSYQISFEFKATSIYPEYFAQYPPNFHFFICQNNRFMPIEGDIDSLYLLGNNIHIIFSIDSSKSSVSVVTTGLNQNHHSARSQGAILSVKRWYRMKIFISNAKLVISVDDDNIISAPILMPSDKFYLRFETWNSTVNYIVRNWRVEEN